MDRRAWWATVHGIAKSNLTHTHTHTPADQTSHGGFRSVCWSLSVYLPWRLSAGYVIASETSPLPSFWEGTGLT